MDAGSGQPSFRTVARGYDRGEVHTAVARLERAVADTRSRVEVLEASADGLEVQVAQARQQVRDVARPSGIGLRAGPDSAADSAAGSGAGVVSGLGAGVDRLLRLAEEQAGDVVQLAITTASGLEGAAVVQVRALRDDARRESGEWRASAHREADRLRESAGALRQELVATSTRAAAERVAVAERDAGTRRGVAEDEARRQRTAVERDLALAHATVRREVTDLLAAARREVEEVRAAAQLEVEHLLTAARGHLEQTLAHSERIATDLQARLAVRTEQAELVDVQRLAESAAEAAQRVSDSTVRREAADRQETDATASANAALRAADQYTRTVLSNARRTAGQVTADARTHADKAVAEATAEAARIRSAARRQVDELTRQRDATTSDIDQLRGILGPAALVDEPAAER